MGNVILNGKRNFTQIKFGYLLQMPISFLSYGPFSSFAPQFDSTWANLCERDSRLLLSTYADK